MVYVCFADNINQIGTPMHNVSLDLAEVRDFAKNLPKIKDNIFEIMNLDTKRIAKDFLETMMSAEISLFLGREKYERQTLVAVKSRNYRNGWYNRSFCVKGIGQIEMRVPRDRRGSFQTSIIPKYERIDDRIKEDCLLLYLTGLSTRTLEMLSTRLFGRKISKSEISELSKELAPKIEQWRNRELTEVFKYLYIDGTNFNMRIDGAITKVCVLVVIGVNEQNQKQVLALQAGDKESSSTWRQLFKDLKKRGLQGGKVQLGLMDGLPGLEKVFTEEFANAEVQRCQVHLARNVLTKCPAKIREDVADDLRSIFYASTRAKAMKFYKEFEDRWAKEIPSAFKSLKQNIESALRFYNYPAEEWLSLRTTNPIERLNKEFKRRTKSMEIVAGEQSCYNLITVIALRMEAHWKKNPINFQKQIPWFKSPKEFTQSI